MKTFGELSPKDIVYLLKTNGPERRLIKHTVKRTLGSSPDTPKNGYYVKLETRDESGRICYMRELPRNLDKVICKNNSIIYASLESLREELKDDLDTMLKFNLYETAWSDICILDTL